IIFRSGASACWAAPFYGRCTVGSLRTTGTSPWWQSNKDTSQDLRWVRSAGTRSLFSSMRFQKSFVESHQVPDSSSTTASYDFALFSLGFREGMVDFQPRLTWGHLTSPSQLTGSWRFPSPAKQEAWI